MKKFFVKAFILIASMIALMLTAIFLPVRSGRQNMLYSEIDKNKLLQNTPSPRIIFVGGSNLAYGLDSKRIKDSLHINPINTGVHINIGLKYMLENTLPYIKKGDIIVLSAEYQQFYGSLADGEGELFSIVADIVPESRSMLDLRQYLKLAELLPEYAQSKLQPILLFYKFPKDTSIGVYDRKAFNIYGDAYAHWNLPGQQYKPYPAMNESFNNNIFNALITFKDQLEKKGAKLYITFPGYQYSSYKISVEPIKNIEKHLKDNNFVLISSPEEYVMPDSLTFDTPYHLIKKGVEIRTGLMIGDLNKVL